jgi:hypothetical protein
VRDPQPLTTLLGHTPYYGDTSTLLYVDFVPTAQEAWTTTVCYGREEEEEKEVGGSERHYGWGEQNLSSVLKVPRHCPFVLLVSVSI